MEIDMKVMTLLAAVALLCGCESLGRLESSAAPTADYTIFVIGLKPEAVKLMFSPGRIQNGAFRQDPMAIAAFNGKPENGYIVGRTKAGDPLALMMADWLPSGRTMSLHPSFWACGGKETLVFDTPKNTVLYLGELEYDHKSRHFTYRSDIERAREYVDKHHPALKGRLAPHGFKLYRTAHGCLPVQTVRPEPVTFSRAP
jgi:hypothetical protein